MIRRILVKIVNKRSLRFRHSQVPIYILLILKNNFADFGSDTISVCDEYTYLGVVFNVNGNFKKAINKQVSQVKHAMFALLTKAAKLHLPIDSTCELFDKLVLPILIYGCEAGGFENIDQIEIFYRNFIRRILNKLTVNCMLYTVNSVFCYYTCEQI